MLNKRKEKNRNPLKKVIIYIIMVKHKHDDDECYCSPGGGIEKGETPEQAAIIDRVFLWASGLLSITEFAEELESWSREISYPNK